MSTLIQPGSWRFVNLCQLICIYMFIFVCNKYQCCMEVFILRYLDMPGQYHCTDILYQAGLSAFPICQEIVVTLERWPLVRGRSKYIDSSSSKQFIVILERWPNI